MKYGFQIKPDTTDLPGNTPSGTTGGVTSSLTETPNLNRPQISGNENSTLPIDSTSDVTTLRPGFNFINVLPAAFMHTDPKIEKKE